MSRGSKQGFSQLAIEDYVEQLKAGRVADISDMAELKASHEVRVIVDGERVTVEAGAIAHPEAPYDLVKTMRASSLVLGPLVARAGAGFSSDSDGKRQPASDSGRLS